MSEVKTIIKTVDQAVNGTTLVDDNELQFVAEPNEVWALHFDLINSADDVASANDRVYMAIKAPSGSTVTAYCFATVDDGTNALINGAWVQGPLTPAAQGTPSSPFGFGAPGATQNPAYAWVRIAALVTMGSVPGPVGLQFCEVTSGSATAATMYAGSTLHAMKQ